MPKEAGSHPLQLHWLRFSQPPISSPRQTASEGGCQKLSTSARLPLSWWLTPFHEEGCWGSSPSPPLSPSLSLLLPLFPSLSLLLPLSPSRSI